MRKAVEQNGELHEKLQQYTTAIQQMQRENDDLHNQQRANAAKIDIIIKEKQQIEHKKIFTDTEYISLAL